jgi:hypothetical protein
VEALGRLLSVDLSVERSVRVLDDVFSVLSLVIRERAPSVLPVLRPLTLDVEDYLLLVLLP